MTKAENIADPASCWNRAGDGEEVFILLGRDPAAPEAVRAWAHARLVQRKNTLKDEQIQSALKWADAVEKNQRGNK